MCGCMLKAIEEPFIVAVREALGDRFTSSVENIYRRTIKFILNTLTVGFEHHNPHSATHHDDVTAPLRDVNGGRGITAIVAGHF